MPKKKNWAMHLVTTKHRGVFVGRVVEDKSPAKLKLRHRHPRHS